MSYKKNFRYYLDLVIVGLVVFAVFGFVLSFVERATTTHWIMIEDSR